MEYNFFYCVCVCVCVCDCARACVCARMCLQAVFQFSGTVCKSTWRPFFMLLIFISRFIVKANFYPRSLPMVITLYDHVLHTKICLEIRFSHIVRLRGVAGTRAYAHALTWNPLQVVRR